MTETDTSNERFMRVTQTESMKDSPERTTPACEDVCDYAGKLEKLYAKQSFKTAYLEGYVAAASSFAVLVGAALVLAIIKTRSD